MSQKELRKIKGVYTATEVRTEAKVAAQTFAFHRLAGFLPWPAATLDLGEGKRSVAKYYTEGQRRAIVAYFGGRQPRERIAGLLQKGRVGQ